MRDKKVAKTRMAEIMAESFSAPTPAARAANAKTKSRELTAENVTLAHAFDRPLVTIWAPTRCRSQATIRSNVRILNRMIGGERIADLTYGRLEKLVKELREAGYAEGTIDRKMNAVSAA